MSLRIFLEGDIPNFPFSHSEYHHRRKPVWTEDPKHLPPSGERPLEQNEELQFKPQLSAAVAPSMVGRHTDKLLEQFAFHTDTENSLHNNLCPHSCYTNTKHFPPDVFTHVYEPDLPSNSWAAKMFVEAVSSNNIINNEEGSATISHTSSEGVLGDEHRALGNEQLRALGNEQLRVLGNEHQQRLETSAQSNKT